ncbi:DUF523 domain-containing protein [methane-oxidizing endosymbiont of Gigantopelta aegis]|uniref:DUF523 domain-containing protein n=1 Tax=methane-oxidizing endosymbiont of Gigantopelta aegis TaxID=2794938 RepID=UPI0018DB5E13|nr:DUF523 domain-containing protein [methane-oxidizing endosymbiont of Gigantopelta aegis]
MASVPPSKPCVGISACLLGERVRYDGDHQYQADLIGELKRHFQLQSFCPEMAAGMGVPRPAIHLVEQAGLVRCVQVDQPERDMTDALRHSFEQRFSIFQALDGFVLKARSPSCGLAGTKLTGKLGQYRNGRGLFAAWLQACFPTLPLIDENALQSPLRLADFIRRVESHASGSK